jgi:tRNA A37 threonylcarbamoyladenosine modification protein TsaB
MADSTRLDTWLLLDAAGPRLIAGLVSDGRWLAMHASSDGFLEALPAAIDHMLRETGLQLPQLAGSWYACGPGSTLGLRLAAMLLRGLLAQPALSHWRLRQYNNLALACAGRVDPAAPQPVRLAAPWRRDRLHLADLHPGPPARYKLAATSPEEAAAQGIARVDLGSRPARLAPDIAPIPYPAERIPRILSAYPELLIPVDTPTLYTAAEPEFVRWSPQRHSAP